MNFRKNIKTFLLVVLFFITFQGFAQGPSEPDEGTGGDGDLNPAPIENYIIPMLLLGVVTAFVLLKPRSVGYTNLAGSLS